MLGCSRRAACASFGTAFGVSRTSGSSSTAQMKDLVGPADFTLQNCGHDHDHQAHQPARPGSGLRLHVDHRGLGAELHGGHDAGQLHAQRLRGTWATPLNREICTNVPAGSYTVTGERRPGGLRLHGSLMHRHRYRDVGHSRRQETRPGRPASRWPAAGSVTCTYTNTQQLGAIEVIKTRKHAATGSGRLSTPRCDVHGHAHGRDHDRVRTRPTPTAGSASATFRSAATRSPRRCRPDIA